MTPAEDTEESVAFWKKRCGQLLQDLEASYAERRHLEALRIVPKSLDEFRIQVRQEEHAASWARHESMLKRSEERRIDMEESFLALLLKQQEWRRAAVDLRKVVRYAKHEVRCSKSLERVRALEEHLGRALTKFNETRRLLEPSFCREQK